MLDRPRNQPVRTGLGVGFLAAFIILALAGSNDLIATHFGLSINAITWVFRFLLFLGPVFAYCITKRICLGLQRKDRELVLHGHESGRIVRFANGEYIEVHTPLDEQERWLRVNYDAPAPLAIAPEDGRPRCEAARATAPTSGGRACPGSSTRTASSRSPRRRSRPRTRTASTTS